MESELRQSEITTLLENESLARAVFGGAYFYADFEKDHGFASYQLASLGFSHDELRDGSYRKRIHPDDVGTYIAHWERVKDGWEDDLYCEYRVRDADGGWHWIETQARVVARRPDGTVARIVGLDRDISARKQAEEYQRLQYHEVRRKFEMCEAMRKTSNMVASDLELSRSLSTAVDHLRDIVRFDRCDIYSLESDALVAQYEPEGCGDGGAIPDASALLPELRESIYPVIIDDSQSDAEYRSCLAMPLRMADDLVGAVVLRHADRGFFHGADAYPIMAFADSLAVAISNHNLFRKTVADLETDELTGFLTRRSFDRNVPSIWRKYCRVYPVNAVAMIDIDRFKPINDTYGHPAGDQVIRRIAELFLVSLRKHDILARYGGEEFIALLPNTPANAADQIMNRIRTACSQLNLCEIPQSVTVSIGVAAGAPQECELGELIAQADAALYRAKNQGRNRVVVADPVG